MLGENTCFSACMWLQQIVEADMLLREEAGCRIRIILLYGYLCMYAEVRKREKKNGKK